MGIGLLVLDLRFSLSPLRPLISYQIVDILFSFLASTKSYHFQPVTSIVVRILSCIQSKVSNFSHLKNELQYLNKSATF